MDRKILLVLLLVAAIYLCLRLKNREKTKIKTIKIKNDQDPVLLRLHDMVSLLDPRIKKLEFYSSNESYTEDKKKVFICLKDETGNYYDFNMLMYVVIHEISHALTNVIDVQHTSYEFRSTFERLLSKAHELGIYNPEKPLYGKYCGLHLNVRNMQR